MTQPRLFSYQRCSMLSQIDGDTVRRQTAAARAYAQQEGLEYSHQTFSDLGVSGYRNKKRSGLEALLYAINTGEIKAGDVIFLEHTDRLSRKGFDDTYSLVREIVQTGVSLYVDSEKLLLNRKALNDLVSVIRLATLASLAFSESANKSKRLLETKGEKRRRAIEGEKQARRLPWWITFDHDEQDYVFNENANIVRQIIQKRLAGISDRKIAVWLNEQGYASPRDTTWKETPVRKLYRHPAVYGAYQTMRTVRDNPDDHTTARFINDTLVENYYPALVSYHEYQALAPKSVPRGKTADHNHLRRLVRCSCGQAIGKKITKAKSGTYTTYFCVGNKDNSDECIMPPFKHLLDYVFRMTRKMQVIKPSAVMQDQATLLAEIRQKEAALEQVQAAIMSGVNVAALIQTSQKLEEEIKRLQDGIVVPTEDKDYFKLVKHEDDPVQWNQLASRLIDQITVRNIKSPHRMGMGKSIGSWHIKLKQRNRHVVSLTILEEKEFWGDTEKVAVI
ncbi:MAG: recombinase family protein [Endozoicomonas sp.]